MTAMVNTAPAYTQLGQLGVLRATGRDTRKFLHGQLTNNITHAPPGSALLAGWCDPKGRMLALFRVAVVADDDVWLITPRDVLDEVISPLSRCILRSKVTLAHTTLQCAGLMGPFNANTPPLAQLPPGQLTISEGQVRIHIDATRVLIAGEPEALTDATQQWRDNGYWQGSENTWELMAVDAGLPAVWLSTMGQFVPQMINLELIGGVDFGKGCYPGQEIVARTQYLGQIKRRMFRLQVTASKPLQPGGQVVNDVDAKVGTVVRSAWVKDGISRALAVLRLDAVDGVIGIPGQLSVKTEILPLPYGLETPA